MSNIVFPTADASDLKPTVGQLICAAREWSWIGVCAFRKWIH